MDVQGKDHGTILKLLSREITEYHKKRVSGRSYLDRERNLSPSVCEARIVLNYVITISYFDSLFNDVSSTAGVISVEYRRTAQVRVAAPSKA
jgi:hypothetical protein